ncbi:jg9341 [Pararge aegeria aegeria]|uniref:Jg9341 protein n=1 Tax=Pararge aegeria aegeria TaxID=348720 RepID=A0A8S4S6I3_9NEOP|nr:jg9341 [Pararge aegeria aegeria]
MLPMVQTEPVLFNCAAHSSDGASPTATLPPSLTPDSEVDGLAEFFYDIDVAVNTFSRHLCCSAIRDFRITALGLLTSPEETSPCRSMGCATAAVSMMLD